VDKLPKIAGFCKDCIHAETLPIGADGIVDGILHCLLWRGDEARNVWIKRKKEYRDYSLVEQLDYCSHFKDVAP